MPDAAHTQPTGHGLGPHVVGQRIVVRRLLPGETGPSGGPAMTDLLGVCLAWAEGVCTVQPETGSPVRIAVADIVSGKPVPPRPSRFARISPGAAEAHVAALWPHVERIPLGEWTLRHDPAPVGRPRRRANSCLAMGAPGVGSEGAIATIVGFYAARDTPALAQVEVDSEQEAAFLEHGWVRLGDGDAYFAIASLVQLRRGLPGARTEGGEANLVETHGQTTQHATVTIGDRARGEAAYAEDWLGLHDLVVEESQRRRGLGTAVIAELLEWGAERGATTVWLHVETDNPAAVGLYERLGFEVHHRARYLTPRR